MAASYELGPHRSQGLVDVLDRILDKGLVIAGDIKINLANVELLTIQVRLLVCSIDKAEQIGLDWWRHDPYLSPGRRALALENEQLRHKIDDLEQQMATLQVGGGRRVAAPRKSKKTRRNK